MRYIAILIAIAFVAGAMPVFAEQGTATAAAGGQKQCSEKTIFQTMYDSIKPGVGKDRNKLKPVLQKVTMFQSMSDGIKEGSKKAKPLTLRTQK